MYSRGPLVRKCCNFRYLIASSIFLAGTSATLPAASEQFDEMMLDEVIVTARKREESLQETPISMTVFSADALRDAGINSIRDFSGKVPGLNMESGNGSNGDSSIFIRGVGQRETKSTIDSGVATYVDGVYLSRAGGIPDTNDIENIQVLRGPQGTLFGKNVTGGAVVISTRKPQAETEGFIATRLGNYNRRDFQSAINAPVVADTLLTRLSLSSIKRDGYMENQVDGENWNDENRQYAQWQWRWIASDSLIVDWFYNYGETDQRPRGQQCLYVGDPNNPKQLDALTLISSGPSMQEACDQNSQKNLDTDEFYSNRTDARYKVVNKTSALTVNWELGDVGAMESLDMKSISAWREQKRWSDEDLDATAIPLLEQLQATTPRSTQLSQELQFIGSALDDQLNITTGIYLFSDKTVDDAQYSVTGPIEVIPGSQLDPQIGALPAILNITGNRDTEADNEAYAWFTQADFDITSQVEVTLGLRWTRELRRTTLFLQTADYRSFVKPGAGTSVFGETGSPVAVVVPGAGGYSVVTDPTELDYTHTVSDVSDVYRDEAWTPMASASYMLADNALDALSLDSAMIFLTYSEGFRSGGLVEASGIDDKLDEFQSEKVRNYEVGIKLDALDRTLRANLALFYTDYDDMQLTTVVADANGRPGSRLDNAGKAQIAGAELELEWLLLQHWRTTLSAAYTDADLKEFDDEYVGAGISEQVACSVKGATIEPGTHVPAPANAPCSSLNTTSLSYVPVISRADEAMSRTPRKQVYFALEYLWDTEFGTFIPHVDMSYRSEISLHFDRDSWNQGGWMAPSKTFYNARVTWLMPDDRLSLALWVQNLRNTDDYLAGGVPLVGFSGGGGLVYSDPRMYGLEFHMRF